MATAAALQRYEAQVRRLARQLASEAGLVSFVASGSLIRRYTVCGNKGCSCGADPPQRHGPYWQWTKKVAGTTVTRRLSDAEAHLFQKWLGDRQRLQATLAAMDKVSERAAALLMKTDRQGSPRRSRRRSRSPQHV